MFKILVLEKFKLGSIKETSLQETYLSGMANVAQPLTWKTSGEQVGRQEPSPQIGSPVGNQASIVLGYFEACFFLNLPHPELRQQMFTAYL